MASFFSDGYGGSLIGKGTSLVTGLVSGLFQKKAQQRAIKAQAEENQKMREYNLMLAKTQNQWNIDQWNRENEYNDPSNQKSRLVAAGLNPDLMYQNGASGLVSASSPDMTAGEPATPQDMSLLANSAASKGIDDALKVAQMDNIRAQTNKLNKDAEGVELDNQFKAGTLDNRIELSRLDIDLAGADIELKQGEAKFMNKQADMLDKKLSVFDEEFSKQMDNLEADTDSKRADADYKRFMKTIEQAHVDNETKQVAINLYEAYTHRALANSQISLNKRTEKNIDADTTLKKTQNAYWRKEVARQGDIKLIADMADNNLRFRIQYDKNRMDVDQNKFWVWYDKIIQEANAAIDLVGNARGIILPDAGEHSSEVTTTTSDVYDKNGKYKGQSTTTTTRNKSTTKGAKKHK